MTDVGPPPRRRGNGLPADKFVPLADVEPRLGEHLLDLLRFADIAAFLEPPGDPRVARRPGVGMVQRLYVERDKRVAARDVVQAAADEAGIPRGSAEPSPGGATGGFSATHDDHNPDDPLAGIDTDAEFAALIADWDVPARDPRSPAEGRAADGGEDDSDAGDPDHADRDSSDRDNTDRDTADRDTADRDNGRAETLAALAELDRTPVPPPAVDDPDDEHYEPPPPPPLPVPAPATVGAAAVFLAGILVVARGDWFGLSGDVSFPLGIVLVLAGFVMFVLRLRDSSGDEDDEDGDEDDGARI